MNKLDRDRLADMLEYAQTAVKLVGTADGAQLEADRRTFLAAWKAIEIIGEAANQVSGETQAELPDIAWRDAISMRHRLVHGYRSVRVEVVVGTVRFDLPPLIVALELALKDTAS